MPAGQRPARLAHLRLRAREDGRQRVPRQLLGERRDRQREQHPAAHREDVAQRVGRCNLAEGARVVDDRRKEVERPDDREVRRHEVGRAVVGRVQAGDQLIRRPARAEAG